MTVEEWDFEKWDIQWLKEADAYDELRFLLKVKDKSGYESTKRVAIPKNLSKKDAFAIIDAVTKATVLDIKWILKVVKEEEITELPLEESG